MAEVEQRSRIPTQEKLSAQPTQFEIDEEKLRKVKQQKQRQDQIHAFIIAALLGMSYIFYSDYASFREQAPKLGIEMRPISDFYSICITAAAMHIVRRIGDKFIRPSVEGRFLTAHGNLPDIELRLDKLTRQIYDAFFYFSIFCFGYYIAGDIEYLPSCIGGAGTCDSLGMYWPKMKLLPVMRTYIIIQFGHHLHNLVYHTVAMKNVGNYFEMIVHHYAAVISLFYSYFTNWEDYAFIILISHDLSDAILNIGKVVRDLGYGKSIALSILYVLLAITWFGQRLVTISFCYFAKTQEYFWWKNPFPAYPDLWLSVRRGVNFIIFNIFIIWILNSIWLIQIVKVGLNTFVKKKKVWVSEYEGEIAAETVKAQLNEKSKDD
jgi:TLC domain